MRRSYALDCSAGTGATLIFHDGNDGQFQIRTLNYDGMLYSFLAYDDLAVSRKDQTKDPAEGNYCHVIA